MRAEDVLHMQADFVQRMRDNRFRGYVGGAIEDAYRRFGVSSADIDLIVEGLATQVRLADCYRVTPDMCDLVKFAADSLDESDTIDRTLPPTMWGFVRFEKPLPVHDIRGRTMLIHFASWGPGAVLHNGRLGKEDLRAPSVTFCSFWNDPHTEPDDVWEISIDRFRDDPFITEVVGRWAFVGAEMMRDGHSLGPSQVHPNEDNIANALREDANFRRNFPDYPAELPPPVKDFTNVQRYMHALWLLLGQTITRVEPEKIKSSAAKRYGKMRIPGRVSVVMLRKTQPRPSEGETHVEWQHRWVVRGHWAWRVCGDKHPLAQAAPVKGGIGCRLWINPYVKGPEDAPFVVTDRVYQFSR